LADAQVDDVAIGVMGYIVPIGITLVGVYLAYTGFTDVSNLLLSLAMACTCLVWFLQACIECSCCCSWLVLSSLLAPALSAPQVLRTFESGWQSVAGEPAQEVFV
jgi:hypothetical protein